MKLHPKHCKKLIDDGLCSTRAGAFLSENIILDETMSETGLFGSMLEIEIIADACDGFNISPTVRKHLAKKTDLLINTPETRKRAKKWADFLNQ